MVLTDDSALVACATAPTAGRTPTTAPERDDLSLVIRNLRPIFRNFVALGVDLVLHDAPT